MEEPLSNTPNKNIHHLSEDEYTKLYELEEPIVRKHEAYEAGADAMLEALRNLTHEDVELDSELIEKGDCAEGTYPEDGFPYACRLVFIPEDEEG